MIILKHVQSKLMVFLSKKIHLSMRVPSSLLLRRLLCRYGQYEILHDTLTVLGISLLGLGGVALCSGSPTYYLLWAQYAGECAGESSGWSRPA